MHANRFVISFAGEREMTPYQLLSALNNHLPRDIRVIECAIAPTDFHARYSATGKRYLYKVYNAPVMDPFYNGLALHFTTRIDERMLDELAKVFVGTHSFGAFCSKKAPAEDRVRTVSAFTVTRQGDLVTFAVTADGFLYNMARAMVGTLLNAARGRIDRAGIEQRLRSGERDNLCATAPACGLYLDEVYYEDVSTPTS